MSAVEFMMMLWGQTFILLLVSDPVRCLKWPQLSSTAVKCKTHMDAAGSWIQKHLIHDKKHTATWILLLFLLWANFVLTCVFSVSDVLSALFFLVVEYFHCAMLVFYTSKPEYLHFFLNSDNLLHVSKVSVEH